MTTPPLHRLSTHLIWGFVGITAFAVGYFAGDQPVTNPRAANAGISSADLRLGTETHGDAREGLAAAKVAAAPLTDDQTRVLAFELLAIPNRIERTRRFCEFLSSLNAENWHGALDAWNIQTTKEFRLNPGEFELLMTRIGEVAGSGAISDALASDKPQDRNNAQTLLSAWAASNGAAASQWFQSQPDELQKQLLKPFIAGLSQSDPQRALSWVLSEPQDVQEGIIPNIIDNAIQLRGFRGAEQLLTPLIGRTDIQDGTRGKLFSKLAHRRIAVGQVTDDPFEALQWFDNYLDISAPGPIATGQLFANAAGRDAAATLSWLDERANRLLNSKGEIGYITAARSLAQQDSGKLFAWLDANQDHPQHDRMIEATAGSLLQKVGIAEIQRLAQTVHDPQLRAKLDGTLQKAATRESSGTGK